MGFFGETQQPKSEEEKMMDDSMGFEEKKLWRGKSSISDERNEKIIPGGFGRYTAEEIGVDKEFQEKLIKEEDIAKEADKIFQDIQAGVDKVSSKNMDEQTIMDELQENLKQLKNKKGSEVAGEILRKAGDKIVSESEVQGQRKTKMLKIFVDMTRSL